jgi:hypothetical protein
MFLWLFEHEATWNQSWHSQVYTHSKITNEICLGAGINNSSVDVKYLQALIYAIIHM